MKFTAMNLEMKRTLIITTKGCVINVAETKLHDLQAGNPAKSVRPDQITWYLIFFNIISKEKTQKLTSLMGIFETLIDFDGDIKSKH